jgi:biotin-dependent carboxylase-like uncharacterized protein
MELCTVKKPGLFTTVQDLGRYGFQRFGVPVSGVMDTYSYIAANLLVGNRIEDACLELTLLGPRLEFLNKAQIAITGADLSPSINDEEATSWRSFQISEGDVLTFGRPKSGCRAYLAIRGGIDVPLVLGSRSTYSRGNFGGFNGRKLEAGDTIKICEPPTMLKFDYALPKELIPKSNRIMKIEVILGPQSEYFTRESLETLQSNLYVISVDSDRMGYRLEGSAVRHKTSDMISDAIPTGAVQIPTDGKPIITMRDSQTTGGYPKIAVVTTPDISRLGQAKPMDKISFRIVSPAYARIKLIRFLNTLNRMKNKLDCVN